MDSVDILLQHPFNRVVNEGIFSSTNKPWSGDYKPITQRKLRIHTSRLPSGHINADWSPLVDECADDSLRRSQPSSQPNPRFRWNLKTEDDVAMYFQQEISAPVMSKFVNYPSIDHQGKAPCDRGGVIVDSLYTWDSKPALIGEFKRNIIKRKKWENGAFENDKEQQRLSRELRGYANMFECPQIFVFDGDTLILFQFRAMALKNFQDCDVDAWIFPRLESHSSIPGYPQRDALFRFLTQGIRRLQSTNYPQLNTSVLASRSRSFFSQEAIWETTGGKTRRHPDGYYRDTDERGRLCWKVNGDWVLDQNGQHVLDSFPLWGLPSNSNWETSEEIYEAD